jgi:translation initiation factor IF-1
MSEKVFKKPEGAVAGLRFIKAKQLADDGIKGAILEGTFVGTIKNTFDETKNDFKFQLDDGNMVIINATGSLTNEMKLIKVGDYVQVNYEGMDKLTKGKMKGKNFHKFNVLVA